MTDTKCPSCKSPAPHLHPAVQHGGEVMLCRDPFHMMVTAENTDQRRTEVARLIRAQSAPGDGT